MKINSVQLQGTIQQSSKPEEFPAVREIRRKGDGGVAGAACRLRCETGSSIAFIGITHWSPSTELLTCQAGDEIILEGFIESRSWEAPDGSKRYDTGVVATTLRTVQTDQTEPELTL